MRNQIPKSGNPQHKFVNERSNRNTCAKLQNWQAPCSKKLNIKSQALNHIQANGQGPMKVFIINQPVRNVIRHGNNLIVETEPSKNGQVGTAQPTQIPQPGVNAIMPNQMSPEAEIANNVNFLKAGMPQENPSIPNAPRMKSMAELNPRNEMSIQQMLERDGSAVGKEEQMKLSPQVATAPQIMQENAQQQIEQVSTVKPKAKRKPVPNHQKDELYWERVSNNSL